MRPKAKSGKKQRAGRAAARFPLVRMPRGHRATGASAVRSGRRQTRRAAAWRRQNRPLAARQVRPARAPEIAQPARQSPAGRRRASAWRCPSMAAGRARPVRRSARKYPNMLDRRAITTATGRTAAAARRRWSEKRSRSARSRPLAARTHKRRLKNSRSARGAAQCVLLQPAYAPAR